MAKTNTGLVAYAKAQLGLPYWYGTFGQIGTEALYNSKKNMMKMNCTRRICINQQGDVFQCLGIKLLEAIMCFLDCLLLINFVYTVSLIAVALVPVLWMEVIETWLLVLVSVLNLNLHLVSACVLLGKFFCGEVVTYNEIYV